MKKIILIVLILSFCGKSFAQTQSALSFSEVIQQEGKNPEQIYSELRNWFVRTFTSSQDVIQYEQENKTISAKATFPYICRSLTWSASSGYVSYNIYIRIKDGRFKITIDNFIHHSTDPNFGDAWSNGLVYKDELSDEELKQLGFKALMRKQYKAIDKRVRPLCYEESAKLLVSLKDFLENSKNMQDIDDDW